MNWRLLLSATALLVGLAACGESDGGEATDPTLTCEEGETLCGESCADTATDPRHCGACGTVCGAEEVCSDGACVVSCPAGQQVCDGACFDLESSDRHCGACGTSCGDSEVCNGGLCETSCPSGQTACDGICVSLGTSPDNCGACGNSCAGGEICSDGACATSCPAGQDACDGGCYSLETSQQNCGACGNACADGEVCVDGGCATSCAAGFEACDGTCRDLETDRNHCGACGTACSADQMCVDGACTLLCASGLAECDGACRDYQVDRENCGACGNACAAGSICVDGACAPACDGFAAESCNGQCTSLQVDPDNCGACGNACAAGEVCSAGVCAGTCAASADVCGGSCTSLQLDPANCGTCGNACTPASNAAPVCAAGECDNVCLAGYGDCDADLASSATNGCETGLASSVDHCGACGNACPLPANASASCTSGTCGIGQCNDGFADCDLDPSNGCETDLMADENSCGTCGSPCMGGLVCNAGACTLPEPGENCSNPAVLTAGSNLVPMTATMQDYFTSAPACGSSYAPDGGDLVLQYSSSINGAIELVIDKPTSTRWHAIASGAACGSLSPELACASEFGGTELRFEFPVSMGQTYYVYLVDSTSGTNPLDNPLQIQVNQRDCATYVPAITLTPANGTFPVGATPTFTAAFGSPVTENGSGLVTITGNLGTSLSYPMPANEVTLSSDGLELTIEPGVSFPAGEQLTISWSGINDALCGSPVVAPTWEVTVPSATCTPGSGGVVGTTVTHIPTGAIGSLTEYYVVADTDPSGWVYVGGTTQLYRISKTGGAIQAVHNAAGLGTEHLGYDILVDGPNIYTADSKTSGTEGHVYRISTDGGATWTVEDAVTFPSTPTDDIHSLAVHDGTIYMMTGESTLSTGTQIWSFTPGAQLPADASLKTTFGSGTHTYCSGLAVDAAYYYTTCRQGSSGSDYALLRIDRDGGAVTELEIGLTGSTTNMAVRIADTNADGIADVLYRRDSREEGQYACAPAGITWVGSHHSYGSGTSDYGLGFDPVGNVLWSFDDATLSLVKVE